jgi:hypothetical protein
MVAVRLLAAAVIAVYPSNSVAEKNIVTETYAIPTTPCEGLFLNGVTYSFTIAGVPSLDCSAGTFVGPGVTNNIQAPNIEGSAAGVLHLAFDVPTTEFGFGVAQNTFGSPQSVVIDLYRPGVGLLREEIALTTTNDPGFVGGRYDYAGPAVKTVTIRFSAGPYTRFAVDNVNYFRPPGQSK